LPVETIFDSSVNDTMSGQYRTMLRTRLLMLMLPATLLGASVSAGAAESQLSDPMRFFEGRTESTSIVKLIMKKPFKSRSLGNGEIAGGVLNLIQQVHDEGKTPYDRRWKMRQVGPGRFSGTMSEAVGPVTAEELGGRYRFRFKVKGNVSVEQWLTPLPGGQSAQSKVSIRKFGMVVGRSDGTVRKL
jgi:hypothetical protein